MSFFVTSADPGSGGDLGGLEGADAHCAALAEAAGVTGKTWAAYLSTSTVDARDRIGSGPWHNADGVVIAESVEALHGDGNNISKETALDETGAVVNGRGDEPNRHDILTGSLPDGTAAPETCEDWTSAAPTPPAWSGTTTAWASTTRGGAVVELVARLARRLRPRGAARHRRRRAPLLLRDRLTDRLDSRPRLSQRGPNRGTGGNDTHRDEVRRAGEARRKAFVAFVMAGDPDVDRSLAVLKGLPSAGVDVVELGHAVHRPDGRRPGDPARRPAGARGRPDDGPHARDGARLPRGRRRDAAGADGLLQPDLFARRRALRRRGEGGRRRRADQSSTCRPRRTPSSACRRRPRGPTSSGWRRRRPTRAGCRGCSRTPRASSTTCRSPASPARPRRTPPRSGRRWRGSRRRRRCRFASASGSGRPTAREIAAVADGAVVGSAIVERIGAGESIESILGFVRTLADAAHGLTCGLELEDAKADGLVTSRG